MRAFSRFCRATARGCLALGIFGLMGLLAAVTWQIIGRYVFNNTPTWAESLALVLVLYVTMLGTAVGVRDSGHIGLESLLVLLPSRWRTRLEYLIHALVLLFGLVMAWQCAVLAESVWTYRLPTLGISEAWRYFPAVLAGVLIALFSVEQLMALWTHTDIEPTV